MWRQVSSMAQPSADDSYHNSMLLARYLADQRSAVTALAGHLLALHGLSLLVVLLPSSWVFVVRDLAIESLPISMDKNASFCANRFPNTRYSGSRYVQ